MATVIVEGVEGIAAACRLWAGPGRLAPPSVLAGELLATVGYGGGELPPDAGVAVAVPNAVLGGEPWLELWPAASPPVTGRAGPLAYAHDGRLLFGTGRLPIAGGAEPAAHALFSGLLALAAAHGYPHLLRVWNYLPGINEERDGLEVYRSFNLGRARAWVSHYGLAAERRFCASSAVGAPGEELLVCFLAARAPGRHVENPRQLAAWRYPPRYGPVGPSFSRLTVAPPGLGPCCFLSGTASVVGHATRHAGDPVAQLAETRENIGRALAAAANHGPERWRSGLGALAFAKVYLRRPADLGGVRAGLASHLAAGQPVLYLEADICRADLLLEIEGVAL
ncbi:MAG: hypothetical protein BWX64_01137 [Acidobacteria bacterium ADurb.Bin051]|jgi:chorismate lyase/3-hydroxybenzoate synthase|nr:MAG: hypothetical protein BWX64_01137 [Acidobacteria bacterium ADurb.Bin051]